MFIISLKRMCIQYIISPYVWVCTQYVRNDINWTRLKWDRIWQCSFCVYFYTVNTTRPLAQYPIGPAQRPKPSTKHMINRITTTTKIMLIFCTKWLGLGTWAMGSHIQIFFCQIQRKWKGTNKMPITRIKLMLLNSSVDVTSTIIIMTQSQVDEETENI